jgi:hypothetical protein
MTTLIAWNNDPALKDAMLRELRWHQEQDKIRPESYGDMSEADGFSGCAVGCSIHSLARIKGITLPTSTHALYEEFGVPEVLAHLEDGIFEGLPKERQQTWPIEFAEAIPVGADLSMVHVHFLYWILSQEFHIDMSASYAAEVVAAIEGVRKLYEDWILTGERPAESAARSAARSARSAARSARSAARSARSAARSAWSAARSAWSAARSAAHTSQADTLLELMKAAPIKEEAR